MKTKEEIIFEMLTENTGRALCDSGGAYGRNWQRNADKTLKDFQNEEEVILSWSTDGTLESWEFSVFHYLTSDGAEFDLDDAGICEEFNNINIGSDNWECEEVYGVSSEAWEFLKSKGSVEVIDTINTYNGESVLSQVLQYSLIDIDQNRYMLLQVHGGADIRGGYTDARLFSAYDYLPSESAYYSYTDHFGIERQLDFDAYYVSDGETGKELERDDIKNPEHWSCIIDIAVERLQEKPVLLEKLEEITEREEFDSFISELLRQVTPNNDIMEIFALLTDRETDNGYNQMKFAI